MVLSFLVVWLDGYHIQSMALVVPTLAAEWSVQKTDFQLVLSAALIGILLGSAFIANMGDRWGRRKVLIISMIIVGVSSICTGYANGMTGLIIWRFLTGLGLGASIPNATTLTSDYVPGKKRAALVTLMFSGVSIGALFAGFVAPWIVSHFGWRGMFTIGGVAPLFMGALLAAVLPESIKLLLVRTPDSPRVPKILARLAPDVDPGLVYAKKAEVQRASAFELLEKPYVKGTLLLWLVFSINIQGSKVLELNYTVASRARFTSVLAICTLYFVAVSGRASSTAAAPAASAFASLIGLPVSAASAFRAR
jgi:MFS transporter, AAHS family, 4-hydroxybenzoate transporter